MCLFDGHWGDNSLVACSQRRGYGRSHSAERQVREKWRSGCGRDNLCLVRPLGPDPAQGAGISFTSCDHSVPTMRKVRSFAEGTRLSSSGQGRARRTRATLWCLRSPFGGSRRVVSRRQGGTDTPRAVVRRAQWCREHRSRSKAASCNVDSQLGRSRLLRIVSGVRRDRGPFAGAMRRRAMRSTLGDLTVYYICDEGVADCMLCPIMRGTVDLTPSSGQGYVQPMNSEWNSSASVVE
jgi:hypothetical protein